MKIAAEGDSVLSILQWITGRQGVAYRHIILLALSLKFPKKLPPKSPKIAVVDNPTLIWRPHPEKPPRISAYTLYFPETRAMAYIFAADSIGPFSFIFVQ